MRALGAESDFPVSLARATQGPVLVRLSRGSRAPNADPDGAESGAAPPPAGSSAGPRADPLGVSAASAAGSLLSSPLSIP